MRRNAVTTEITSLKEHKIATIYQSRVTSEARWHANLPEEVGRNTVAYGDSRYLQSMPLRTQQYRTRHSLCIFTFNKLTTSSRWEFVRRTNKLFFSPRNWFAKFHYKLKSCELDNNYYILNIKQELHEKSILYEVFVHLTRACCSKSMLLQKVLSEIIIGIPFMLKERGLCQSTEGQGAGKLVRGVQINSDKIRYWTINGKKNQFDAKWCGEWYEKVLRSTKN